KTLAYVSDETGVFQVWTMELDSKEKRVYPIEEYIHYPLSAYWGDKNRLLIPSDEGLQSFEVATGKSELIRPLKTEEENIMRTVSRKMTVNKTATHAYFQFDGALWAYDIKDNIDKFIGENNAYRNKILFNVTPDGNKVLYYTTSKTDYSKLEL